MGNDVADASVTLICGSISCSSQSLTTTASRARSSPGCDCLLPILKTSQINSINHRLPKAISSSSKVFLQRHTKTYNFHNTQSQNHTKFHQDSQSSIMSAHQDPDVQQFVEIRDFLFSLLDRTINGATSSNLNEAIRSRIRALQANPLYSKPWAYGLRNELDSSDGYMSRSRIFSRSNDKQIMEKRLDDLRYYFGVFERLRQEAARRAAQLAEEVGQI